MKLGEILYEADNDFTRDSKDNEILDAEGIEDFTVALELYDEHGVIMKGSPDTIEVEVTEIAFDGQVSYEVVSVDAIDEFLDNENKKKSNMKYPYYTSNKSTVKYDFEFDINLKDKSGTVSTTAEKDDTDIGQK